MAKTTVPVSLIMKAWAKDTWEAGMRQAFFSKFTGNGADNIVQIKTELQKGKGDSINIPLLMPLSAAGVTGDNELEGNEEALIYRDFEISINQVRNAVRIAGQFEEQKTQQSMRDDAKTALADWLATKVDKDIFSALTTAPSKDRIVYSGAAEAESELTASDKFSAALIGKAKRVATADENTMVKPIKVNGADTYILIVDQWQARDLMNDEKWINAQQYANIRGNDNPIFTGALGMYDGVVLHQCNRISRTATGASGVKVGHALFLGAQAAVMAVGNNPTWNEKKFDYDNQAGFAFGRMFGIKKAAFDYDGDGTATDFGCINVLTSSADD